MTAVQLVNLALLKIGVSKGITTTSDATREAYTAAEVFDHILRATLRQFPWSFATKYLQLTQTQGPPDSSDATVADNIQAWASGQIYAVGDVVIDSGVIYVCILAHSTDHEPPNATYWSSDTADYPTSANPDWDYAYRWPSDCLFARRFLSDGATESRKFSENPITFRVGRDQNGLLLYSNEPTAWLEYTVIDCDHLWADDLFIDAFTWKLGAYLAPSLARDDKMATKCEQMFQLTYPNAATVSSREQQQEKNGDAEWINAR